MVDPTFNVSLDGPGPYGFRVTGGVECKMPIRIALVRDDTKASDAMLEAGLLILQINGMTTSQMTQKMAKRAIKSANGRLNLVLMGTTSCLLAQEQKPQADPIIPNPEPEYIKDIEDRPPAPLPGGLIPIDNEFDNDSGYSPTPSIAGSLAESIMDPIPGVCNSQSFDNLVISNSTDPIPDVADPQFDTVFVSESRPPSPPPPPLPERCPPPLPPPNPPEEEVVEAPQEDDDVDVTPRIPFTFPGLREDDAKKMKCGGCKKKIKAKHMFVKVEGISWHGGCLNCSQCHMSLFNKAYSVRQGQPICTDHEEITDVTETPNIATATPVVREDDAKKMKCGGCKKKIKAKHMFVKVEGVSWHGGCLNCTECHVALLHKVYSVRQGQPICTSH